MYTLKGKPYGMGPVHGSKVKKKKKGMHTHTHAHTHTHTHTHKHTQQVSLDFSPCLLQIRLTNPVKYKKKKKKNQTKKQEKEKKKRAAYLLQMEVWKSQKHVVNGAILFPATRVTDVVNNAGVLQINCSSLLKSQSTRLRPQELKSKYKSTSFE